MLEALTRSERHHSREIELTLRFLIERPSLDDPLYQQKRRDTEDYYRRY